MKWLLFLILLGLMMFVPLALLNSPLNTQPTTFLSQKRVSLDLGEQENIKYKKTTTTMEATVIHVYCWRDWMPDVSNPGPDGGSPLQADIQVQFYNPTDTDKTIHLETAFLEASGYTSIPLVLTPKQRDTSTSWNGTIQSKSTQIIHFSTKKGPYLPVGTKVNINLFFRDQTGQNFKVEVMDQAIERTD